MLSTLLQQLITGCTELSRLKIVVHKALVSFRYDEELVIPIVENKNEEIELVVSSFILCVKQYKLKTA